MGVLVLVEGDSDKAAVETLMARVGLDTNRVDVVAVGGASKFGAHLRRLDTDDRRVLGLYDIAEESEIIRALALESQRDPTPGHLGFFACDADLEDEMIRAVGVEAILDIFDAEGEMASFRRMRAQPQWRERPIEEQLRRFLGTKARRKVRYGTLLAQAVSLDALPHPLARLIDEISPRDPSPDTR